MAPPQSPPPILLRMPVFVKNPTIKRIFIMNKKIKFKIIAALSMVLFSTVALAAIQYEKDPYKITIKDVINWYEADIGLEKDPTVVDKYLISEGNSKGYLYDGELRGWVNVHFPNGRLKRKLYFNPDFSSNKHGRVNHKSFDYFYYQGDVYATFGGGESYPMFWLKNGKPYNRMLTLGYPAKNKNSVKGDLDSPSGKKGVWFRLYVKNGLANGIAEIPGALTTDTGKFKNGFKNGEWDRKCDFDMDKDGLNEHLVTKYNMGKEIETIDKFQSLKNKFRN